MSKASEVDQLSSLIRCLLHDVGLDAVLKAARAFTDDKTCLDKQCMYKVCVLNKAFAKLDRELEK